MSKSMLLIALLGVSVFFQTCTKDETGPRNLNPLNSRIARMESSRGANYTFMYDGEVITAIVAEHGKFIYEYDTDGRLFKESFYDIPEQDYHYEFHYYWDSSNKLIAYTQQTYSDDLETPDSTVVYYLDGKLSHTLSYSYWDTDEYGVNDGVSEYHKRDSVTFVLQGDQIGSAQRFSRGNGHWGLNEKHSYTYQGEAWPASWEGIPLLNRVFYKPVICPNLIKEDYVKYLGDEDPTIPKYKYAYTLISDKEVRVDAEHYNGDEITVYFYTIHYE